MRQLRKIQRQIERETERESVREVERGRDSKRVCDIYVYIGEIERGSEKVGQRMREKQ